MGQIQGVSARVCWTRAYGTRTMGTLAIGALLATTSAWAKTINCTLTSDHPSITSLSLTLDDSEIAEVIFVIDGEDIPATCTVLKNTEDSKNLKCSQNTAHIVLNVEKDSSSTIDMYAINPAGEKLTVPTGFMTCTDDL